MKTLKLLLVVYLLSSVAFAASKQTMKQELQQIATIFETLYAPKSWKEKYLNWDLKAELAKAQALIDQAQTVQEHRAALAQFLLSTGDYHVGFGFYATEQAQLPFTVRTVEGKTIVVYIDREKLNTQLYDFSEGDEILAFDGRPIAEILKDIKRQIGQNTDTTDLALADLNLTRRRASRNFIVPKGPVEITYQKKDELVAKNIQLSWEYWEEKLPGHLPARFVENETSSLKRSTMMMVSPFATEFVSSENRHLVGTRKSFLPDFGERIWESGAGSEFDAYIFQNEDGKLIGVVRIPRYAVKDYDKAVDDFAVIIKKMQATTSALIIDQLNNPGGSVFYLYALASMLTDTTLKTPKHRMSLRPEDLDECVLALEKTKDIKNDEEAVKILGKRDGGYPMSYELVKMMRDFCDFMFAQNREKLRQTDPYFLWGVDHINPHSSAQYKKPILLLVNELDFSGGDFFPAILQDNKRATIVGTQTSGAGGYVLEVSMPNSFGLRSFSYTGSLAERVDKNPIENLGVTPDVKLQMTVDDYRNQFRGYLKSVKEEVKKLIK